MTYSDTEAATKPYAIQFLLTCTIVCVLILLTFNTNYLQALRFPLIYLLPAALVYSIILTYFAMRKGPSSLPLGWFLTGAFFIVGGPAFDIYATLIHDPDLGREDNVVARLLLDSGRSLNLVLAYGIVVQTGLAILVGILWAGFLKHKDTVLMLARGSGATSAPLFVKAAMGGGALTWRQFLFPMKIADLPNWYCMLWFTAAMLSGASIYRWYLGLEWFEIFRFNRLAVQVFSCLIPVSAYTLWLGQCYSKKDIF